MAPEESTGGPPFLPGDANLLFAIFAIQLNKATPAKIMEAAAAWATDPSRDLQTRLINDGVMSPRDVDLIRRLVEEAVSAHDGDVASTLDTFGGRSELQASLLETGVRRASARVSVSETVAMAGTGPESLEDAPSISDSLPSVEELPGRYSQKSEHARGGQGRLLVVHDDELGRDIIMKELLNRKKDEKKPETPIRRSASMISRFLQEARITGQLEHPSIVPVYELGRRSDGTLYYTMKLVRGESLEHRIASCKNLSDRLGLLPHFTQLCHGVAYAHTRGVIHRDLKPHNVMVGEFGETLVIDWGLAKVKGKEDEQEEALSHSLLRLRERHGDETPNTLSGELLGTPMYMPPEQALGKVHMIDERSDVYALGAILFRMLSGETPYESTTIDRLLDQIQTESPRDLRDVVPDVPAELAAICRRCMAHDRRDRYRNAQELAADVERYQTGALVGAYSYSIPEMTRRVYRQHKAAINTAAAAAMVLMVVAAYSFAAISTSRDAAVVQRDAARRNAYVSSMHLVAELMRSREYDQANEKLFGTSADLRHWEWGYLVNRCNLDVQRFHESRMAAFSPDEAFIATTSRKESIRIWDTATSALIKSIDVPTFVQAKPLDIAYNRDGTLLFGRAPNGTISVWGSDSAQLEHVIQISPGKITSSFRVPGTDSLLTGGNDGVVREWDLRDGTSINEYETSLGSISDVQTGSANAHILSFHSTPFGQNKDIRRTAQLLRVDEKMPVLTAPAQTGAISSDETHFVLANRTVSTLYDVSSRSPVAEWTDHTGYIRCVAFSPDGALVATAGDDGNVVLYGIRERARIRGLDHGFPVDSLAFDARGTRLLATSKNGVFNVWDTFEGRRLNALEGHEALPFSASFDPSGDRIMSGSLDDTVRIWNSVRSPGITDIRAYSAGLIRADFSRDGRLGAILTDDGWLEIFDMEDRRVLHEFGIASPRGGACVAFSDTSSLVMAALDVFTPMIWDVETGELVQTLPVHPGRVFDVAIFPDENRVTTGCWDGRLRIYDLGTRDTPLVIDAHEKPVQSIAISPNGEYIASGASDGFVRLWSASDGKLIKELDVAEGYVGEVTFSNDGTWLAAAAQDNTLKVWAVTTGELVAERKGHSGSVRSIVFTPDDWRLISGSTGGAILVWDTANWVTVASINNDVGGVAQVNVSDDGFNVLAAFNGGIVRRFEAAPWQPADPDSDGTTGEALFARYRDDMREEWRNDYSMEDAAQFALWTTPESLYDNWDRILTTRPHETISTEGNMGLPISGPVPELMLPESTYVLRIEGVGVDSSEQGLAQARDALAKHKEDPRNARLEAVLNRGGRRQNAAFEMVEPKSTTVSKRIPVEEVREIIAFHLDAIKQNRRAIAALNNEAVSSMGAAARDRGIAGGIWLPETGDEAPTHNYERLGMCPGDRLMAINDQPLNNVNDLMAMYEALLDNNLAGQDVNLHIQRGQFQRLNVRIHVINE